MNLRLIITFISTAQLTNTINNNDFNFIRYFMDIMMAKTLITVKKKIIVFYSVQTTR